MVERIYELKNQVLDHIGHVVMERGIDRIDPNELGMMVDNVKDLAEAEKDCWKAEYYRAVTEAMENGKAGYTGGMRDNGRSGLQNQHGSGYARRGYSSRMGYADMVEGVRVAMQDMTPEERDRMRDQLRSAIEGF